MGLRDVIEKTDWNIKVAATSAYKFAWVWPRASIRNTELTCSSSASPWRTVTSWTTSPKVGHYFAPSSTSVES